jgi:hypothetical protein
MYIKTHMLMEKKARIINEDEKEEKKRDVIMTMEMAKFFIDCER